MNRRIMILAGVCGLLLLGMPSPVQAYVGPGAGISLLGALWALIAVIGSAILYVVLWPLRRMRRRRKQDVEPGQAGRTPDPDQGPAENATGPQAEATKNEH